MGDKPARLRHMNTEEQALQQLQQLQHRPSSLTHTPRVTTYAAHLSSAAYRSPVAFTAKWSTRAGPPPCSSRVATTVGRWQRSFEVVRPVHTAAHGPPRTYQRETVTVVAGRSKIHTCRTDDTGLPVTQCHTTVTLCAAELASMGSRCRLRRRVCDLCRSSPAVRPGPRHCARP